MEKCDSTLLVAQQWAWGGARTLHLSYTLVEGLCADAGSASPAPRAEIALSSCDPTRVAAQGWFAPANSSSSGGAGHLVHAASGLCASVEHDSARAGARVDLTPCADSSGAANLQWTFDAATRQLRTDALNGLCLTACTPREPTPSPPSPAPSASVLLDVGTLAHRHDGVTAMSVNGAARLLYEYREPARSQLLDLFFAGNNGTDGPARAGTRWQALKIEIGGDVESSYGAMSSFMHVPDPAQASFARGVQFWLIAEARKRNPLIPLLCLSWGMPFWVGNGSTLSAGGAKYHVDFLLGAKAHHGIEFQYVGIWNEAPWTAEYIVMLRQQLDDAGLQTTAIVAADGDTSVIKAAAEDHALAAAIGAFGVHTSLLSPDPDVAKLGKPYWSSENDMVDGPMPQWGGTNDVALGWPATFARNFARANGTATMLCAFVHSWSQSLGRHNHGPAMLNDPWSGFYQLGASFFTQAHWTQFTEPGWRFLGGGVAQERGDVVFAALAPEDGSELTLVAVNAGDSAATLPLTLAAGATRERFGHGGAPLQQWRSNETRYFARVEDAPPADAATGALLVELPARSVLTLSSRAGAGWAEYVVPQRTPFPLPHAPKFGAQPVDAPCLSLSPIYGAFEVAAVAADEAGPARRVCRQPVPQNPGPNAWTHRANGWPVASTPSGSNFANFVLSARVRIEEGGLGDVHAVTLCGRMPIWSPSACMPSNFALGVCLSVLRCASASAAAGCGASATDTVWRLTEAHNNLHQDVGDNVTHSTPGRGGFKNACKKLKVLASGALSSVAGAPDKWHTLSLSFSDTLVSASLDGAPLPNATNVSTTLSAGVAALGSAWNPASFEALSLAPHPAHGRTKGSFLFDVLPSEKRGDAKFTGFAGMILDLGPGRYPPGGAPLRVLRLGRFKSAGNARVHTLAMAEAADGSWLPRANCTVDMGACVSDLLGFCYCSVASAAAPLLLSPGHGYYVVSSEEAGGDAYAEMTASATGTDMGHRDGDTLMTYRLPTGANSAAPMAAGGSLVTGRVRRHSDSEAWQRTDSSADIDTAFGPVNLVLLG